MADLFVDFGMPDTTLTRQAHDFAARIESPALVNHSVRSYLFGRAVGQALQVAPYDDEMLLVACLLHDAGLSERGDRDQRFEVDGADLAAEFLRGHGLAEDRIQTVWTAIALHTSVGIAHRMPPEIALVHLGAGVDLLALGAEQLPEGLADRVHAALPRLEVGQRLTQAILDQAVHNPAKAPAATFPGELLRQAVPHTSVVDWRSAAAAAWPEIA